MGGAGEKAYISTGPSCQTQPDSLPTIHITTNPDNSIIGWDKNVQEQSLILLTMCPIFFARSVYISSDCWSGGIMVRAWNEKPILEGKFFKTGDQTLPSSRAFSRNIREQTSQNHCNSQKTLWKYCNFQYFIVAREAISSQNHHKLLLANNLRQNIGEQTAVRLLANFGEQYWRTILFAYFYINWKIMKQNPRKIQFRGFKLLQV